MTAVPDTGYHFVSWSDGYPTAARTDTNVTADITVSASFAINAATYSSYKGTDRFDTAIRVSQASYPAPLPAGSGVVLAPGWESYQEALCGSPLAAAWGGPVLLSSKTVLYGNVSTELQRLAPARVFCIGLTAALADAVRAALPAATVTSINGTGTTANIVYDMSYQVAKALGSKVGDMSAATAIVTTGTNFPDAIGVSPLACAKKWPILLTNNAQPALHAKSAQAISELGITHALKVGTYATLPVGVAGVGNCSGADRYYTNAAVAIWGQDLRRSYLCPHRHHHRGQVPRCLGGRTLSGQGQRHPASESPSRAPAPGYQRGAHRQPGRGAARHLRRLHRAGDRAGEGVAAVGGVAKWTCRSKYHSGARAFSGELPLPLV